MSGNAMNCRTFFSRSAIFDEFQKPILRINPYDVPGMKKSTAIAIHIISYRDSCG